MIEFEALNDELQKLADVDDMRLRPPPTMLKPVSAAPPNPAFVVKRAFTTSSYSGIMNVGPFPQASSIPPWREAPLQRVKTSGPPPEDARLEASGDVPAPNGTAQLRKGAAAPLSPAGRLESSQTVGASPRMNAPGPSIAQQAKPKGFGLPLPGLVKKALGLSAMRTIAGGALGAGTGALAGSTTADEGHTGRGAIGGALLGGALGATGGHVLPRMRAGMQIGMSPKGALHAVGEDLKAHVHAATAPRNVHGPIPPSVSTRGLTEAGGAQNAAVYGGLPSHLQSAIESTPLVRAGVPPPMAMQLAYMSRDHKNPNLVNAMERVVGGRAPPRNQIVSSFERDVPTLVPASTSHNLPTVIDGVKAAAVKVALLERLVRLAATPIPGTPQLLMKSRSPTELGQLQSSVASGWDKHVTSPILRAAEPVLNHVPAAAQGAVRRGARLVAEDPVGTLAMGAVPIPGAHSAYFGAKKGLERAIDRVAPATPT